MPGIGFYRIKQPRCDPFDNPLPSRPRAQRAELHVRLAKAAGESLGSFPESPVRMGFDPEIVVEED